MFASSPLPPLHFFIQTTDRDTTAVMDSVLNNLRFLGPRSRSTQLGSTREDEYVIKQTYRRPLNPRQRQKLFFPEEVLLFVLSRPIKRHLYPAHPPSVRRCRLFLFPVSSAACARESTTQRATHRMNGHFVTAGW